MESNVSDGENLQHVVLWCCHYVKIHNVSLRMNGE